MDTLVQQDLSRLERTDLISALRQMQNILQTANQKANELDTVKARLEAEEEKAEGKRSDLTPEKKKIWWISVGVCAFLGVVFGGFFGMVLAAVAGGIVSYLIILYIDNQENGALKQQWVEDYRREYVEPLQAELKTLQEEFDTFIHSDSWRWATNAISKQYFSISTLNELIGYLQSCRADSLKEAINLYEEVMHRERMEQMQQEMVNSTREQESALRNIEHHARQSAEAARRTADSARQTAKTSKKIYREIIK